MDTHRVDETTTGDVRAEMRTLRGLLEAQGAKLAVQGAKLAAQEAEIARLKPAAPPDAAPPGAAPPGAAPTAAPRVKRRGVLGKVLGATAAAAALTMAQEAAGAKAAARTTVLSGAGTTNSYGLVATFGVTADPADALPPLGGKYFGVIGTVTNAASTPPRSAGVWGLGDSLDGVLGTANSGFGVYGLSQTGTGVFGGSNSLYGVYGNTNASASAIDGAGIYGTSSLNRAIWGRTATGTGVYGQATGGGYGVYGSAPAPAGYAGFFQGNVLVQGGFAVTGGPKNALIEHPDGSLRRMYCQESPDPWFEDFGRAVLRDGQATVRLDPDFDALVRGDDYHIFLSEIGDGGGLYVADVRPHAFVVRSRAGGDVDARFSYRVVARRKDLQNVRLEKVDRPKRVETPTPRSFEELTAAPHRADASAPEAVRDS